MSFFRGNETITIKRRSANSVDEYGNTTHSLTTITVHGCMIGVTTGNEPIDINRDAVDAKLTLYLPNGTAVESGDRFVVRGTEWVKDGDAQNWVPPFDFEVGVVVNVRKRSG